MSERGKSRRVRFKRTIKYGVGEPTNFGYAYELDEDGIGIYTESPIDKGKSLVIEILLQNEFILIEGEASWSVQDPRTRAYKTKIKITTNHPKLEKVYKQIRIIRHAKTFY